MLHLDRDVGEAITIGDNIVVTILAIKGRSVRIGIDAPKDVKIMRPEAKLQQPRDYDVNGNR